MAERRSLVAAVSTPVPGVDSDTVRSFVSQNQSSERPIAEPAPILTEPKQHRGSFSQLETLDVGAFKTRSKKPSRFQPVGLIPITVRLRPEIAGALKRASLERELEGEEVFTQQDLVEHVLEPWLRQEGFIT